MPTFPESDLLFTFPDDWIVRKYDDTVAYQSLSGHGLKGVDFIALTPAGELWFVEAKNYRPRRTARGEYRADRPAPEELTRRVAGKFHDTGRLLRIVSAALQRRWWTRWQLRWMDWRGRPRPHSNYWFWTEALRRLEADGTPVCLLWLETPEAPDHYGERVRELLAAALPPGYRLLVAETERHRNLPVQATQPPTP